MSDVRRRQLDWESLSFLMMIGKGAYDRNARILRWPATSLLLRRFAFPVALTASPFPLQGGRKMRGCLRGQRIFVSKHAKDGHMLVLAL